MGIAGVTQKNPTDTLAEWKSKSTKLGFDGVPEVAINSMVYRGNFVEDGIFEATCASLDSPPTHCFEHSDVEDNSDSGNSAPSNHHVLLIVLCSLGGLIVAIIITWCLYNRFVKGELTRDMSSRVGELVATYANKVSSQRKKQRERLV